MEWQPIETAKAVGKKRLLFLAANGKQFTGWRLAGSKMAMPEFGSQWVLCTKWQELPPFPENT